MTPVSDFHFGNTYHPDVPILCETWLTPNRQFNIPSYSCYRRDRPVYDNPHNRDPTRGYGGVAVLIRNGVFGNIQLLDIPSTGFEAVVVSAAVLEPSHTTQHVLDGSKFSSSGSLCGFRAS